MDLSHEPVNTISMVKPTKCQTQTPHTSFETVARKQAGLIYRLEHRKQSPVSTEGLLVADRATLHGATIQFPLGLSENVRHYL